MELGVIEPGEQEAGVDHGRCRGADTAPLAGFAIEVESILPAAPCVDEPELCGRHAHDLFVMTDGGVLRVVERHSRGAAEAGPGPGDLHVSCRVTSAVAHLVGRPLTPPGGPS